LENSLNEKKTNLEIGKGKEFTVRIDILVFGSERRNFLIFLEVFSFVSLKGGNFKSSARRE
jgi:hypothetical protein